MERETTIDIALRLAEERGWNQNDLARELGTTPASLSNWKKRGMPVTYVTPAARAFGLSTDEFLNGGKPASSERGVAQDMSQLGRIVDPRQLEWGSLMTDALPESFSLVLRDDALGDQGSKGNIAEFSTKVPPIEGRGVLFKDQDGNTYVRIYQVARGAQWRAISAHPSKYAALDSDADGLQILAVMVGVKWA